MKRDITEKLFAWKDRKDRKPLLLTGVRQCGKTYILKEFGRSAFKEYAYFNFDGNTGLQSIFDFDFDTKRILRELEELFYEGNIIPGETLVVFDEIQACPRAISSLKYFCENMPDLHLIAAGSLLGVALHEEGISFPVGKVDRLTMYPMSFTEFVEADAGAKYLGGIRNMPLERELPEAYTVPMEKYLKNYYIVGGMPEVVQKWIDTHDFREVERIQDQILEDYPDDFGKHATPLEAVRISLVWDSVPVQIARDNNKFIFSHVKSGLRAKDLEDSLQWLVDAGLVYKCFMVPTPELPLSGMADQTYFKVYMADVGLLRRKLNISYRIILSGDPDYIRFKGAIAENYVMTQLSTMGIAGYFWRSNAAAEVDFITDWESVLMPIEVKSADNTKAKSLHTFCQRYQPRIAVRSSLKNVGDNMDGSTHVWSIPLYCFFRLKEYAMREIEREA